MFLYISFHRIFLHLQINLMVSWALISSVEEVNSQFALTSASKSLAPTWSYCSRPPLFWVLDESFSGKGGICAEDVALFTVTCEAALVGVALQGSARVSQWFPDIFCQWPFWHVTKFHRLPFSFEPKFPFFPCSTPAASMRDTHSKHSSFLKSRLWQLWVYSFAFHCLYCSPPRFLQRLLLK